MGPGLSWYKAATLPPVRYQKRPACQGIVAVVGWGETKPGFALRATPWHFSF